MRRQALRSSRAGLLLVEAVLSAVVIATGLVFVSRGFSGQLKALERIQRSDILLTLARNKLNELEGERLGGLTPAERAGGFEAPYEGYQWTLEAIPREDWTDAAGNPLTYEVTLVIARGSNATESVRLKAMWPSAWMVP